MPIVVPLPFLSSFVLAWRVCVVFLCSTNSVMNKGKCCVVSVVFTQNCVVPIALKKTLVPKTMASSAPICWQTRNCFHKTKTELAVVRMHIHGLCWCPPV